MLQSVKASSSKYRLYLESNKNENKKAEKRFQFEQERNECLKKKQRLSDLHKALNDDFEKYSMEACSIAHITANSKKVQELLCKAGAMKEKANKLMPETKEILKLVETFYKIKTLFFQLIS